MVLLEDHLLLVADNVGATRAVTWDKASLRPSEMVQTIEGLKAGLKAMGFFPDCAPMGAIGIMLG